MLFDGEHNLRFGAVSNTVERISSDISNYETAFGHIQKKYCKQLAELEPRQARRFLAQVKILLTSKYLQQVVTWPPECYYFMLLPFIRPLFSGY